METLDPDLRKALMNLPGGFNDLQRSTNDRFSSMEKQIESLPEKIFNTKFKVKNGEEKEMSVKDILTDGWNSRSNLEREIRTGEIFVPVIDRTGKESRRKLKDVLSDIVTAPSRLFDSTAKFSSNFVKIGTFVIAIAIVIFTIVTLINGAK